MKVLVLGDIHLKPRHFDRAQMVLDSGQADLCVQMGDMVDDWGEEFNIGLYERTLGRALDFQRKNKKTLWVIGNHDFAYWHSSTGRRESGHSILCEDTVRAYLDEMEKEGANFKIMHEIDGVIFTHAGLTLDWLRSKTPAEAHWEDELEFVKELVNNASPEELWQENSPIWARPQIDHYDMYPAKLQVVGHTPVETATEKNGVLSVDTLSTYRDSTPIGDRGLVIVDTETGEWHYAEEV